MVKKYLKNPVFLSCLICIFIFYSGLFKLPERNHFKSVLPLADVIQVYGKIKSSPVKTSNNKYYSADFELFYIKNRNALRSNADGKIKVFIPSSLVEAYYPGKLYSASKTKIMELFETGGFYAFNGKLSDGSFYADNCSLAAYSDDFWGRVSRVRAKLRLQFKRLMYSWGAAGGLLLALLSGAREYTEASTSNAFKNAGLSHILALSGMHLSMFGGIAVYFGKKIGIKKLSFIIRCIALVLFVWFAGFSPSLLRAFICNVILITAAVSNVKNPDMMLVLCLSFLIQIVISPSDLYNTGFLLSYGALAGILLTNSLMQRFYNRFIPYKLATSVASSTGAQIFTAPLSLKLFGSFAPIGIIATTVVSPLITIFIYSGLGLIILSLIIPSVSGVSGILMNFLYNIIKYLVLIFSKFPMVKIK